MDQMVSLQTAVSSGKIDTAEFLSAVGTFLATLVAFVSVGVILLREDPQLGWVIGVMMQITAGTIARTSHLIRIAFARA